MGRTSKSLQALIDATTGNNKPKEEKPKKPTEEVPKDKQTQKD